MGVLGITAALWGLFGGFAIEGLDLHVAIRRNGRWPFKTTKSEKSAPTAASDASPAASDPTALQYAIGELIRLVIGAGLAWAAVATHQIDGPLGAIAVGAAAPVIVGQLAKTVPLTSVQPANQKELAVQPDKLPAPGGD